MLRKLVAAIICAGVMAPSTVFGLGMGQVKLDSFLNQPLEAKIELLQTRGLSSAEIIAGMASSKEFAAAGVDRSFFLSQLKFEVQEVDGKLFVVVTSKKPVTEPYLNFLVEVQWPAGRLLREYTLLLDPPEFADALPLAIRAPETQPATEVTAAASERASTGVVPREKESQQLAETAMSAQAETQPESDAEVTELVVPELDMSTAEATADPVSSERQAPSTVQQANKAVSDVVVPGSTIQSYTVRSGDTLNGIVSKTLGGDPSISNQQALIAFQYLNPDAFIDDNVNLVKKGAVLRVPSEAEVRQISREEAIQEIAAHNKAWRARVLAVQNRKNEALAGRQLDGTGRELAPNATPDEGDQGRLSLVAPGVEEDGASARGEAGEGALADYRVQLVVAREMTEQVKVSNEGLVAELNELTALVEKTDSLLALKNEQIAALKSELEAIREAQGEMAADINQDVAVIDEESTDMVDEQPSVDLESEAQDEMVEDTASEGAESEEASAEELTFTEVDADSAVEETVLEETPVDVPSQDFDESISQAPSVSSIFTNPLYLGIGGSALIALLLLLWLRSRNSDDEDEEFEEELDDDEEEDHSFDADLRGITEEGLDRDLLKSDDEFDLEAALSEADIYVAYGHFPKAIAMIEEALQTAPEALPLQMKLLEIYAESKDLDLFQATEVKLRGGDLDDEALAYINGLRQELGLRPGNGPVKEADVGFGEEETEFVSEFTQAPDEPEETAVSGKVEDEQDDLLSLADIEAELDMGYEFDEDDSQPDLGAAASSAVSSTNFNEELTVTSDFQEEGTAENRFIAEETNVHLDDELDLSSGELNFSFEETSVPEDDLEDFSPDDALADIDQEIGGLGKEAAVQEMASQENKLNISMEIDGMGSVIEEDPDAGFSLDEEAVASGPALSSEDESLLEGVDEVGTKLDLATAYIDMGDHEGAKDILDEVMLEGNEDQQQKARELMSRVG